MSRQVIELESVLQMLVEEHRRMLVLITTQQASMKTMQLDAMQDATHRQESSRMRIATLDNRRRLLAQQLAKLAKFNGELTLAQIAQVFPQNGPKLLKLRDELKGLIRQIAERTHVAGRVAAAVLGHLNTAMRLFAGAVGQTGVYTKHGTPRVAGRIGVMDAVG